VFARWMYHGHGQNQAPTSSVQSTGRAVPTTCRHSEQRMDIPASPNTVRHAQSAGMLYRSCHHTQLQHVLGHPKAARGSNFLVLPPQPASSCTVLPPQALGSCPVCSTYCHCSQQGSCTLLLSRQLQCAATTANWQLHCRLRGS
jgi:hypothetical protein